MSHTHCKVRHFVYAPIWPHCVQVVPSAIYSSQYKIGTNLSVIPEGHRGQNTGSLMNTHSFLMNCEFNKCLTCSHTSRYRYIPVQHILKYVDGHDDTRVPPAVQREDGEVGGEKVRGLLCICCCTCSTTTRKGERDCEGRDEGKEEKRN